MAITIEDWRSQAEYFDFDGTQIAYWRKGTGRPLLLVHGFATSSWDWAPIWQILSTKHSLIAADMIGFGLSDKPRTEYSIHRQADMQAALLNHLGITDFDAVVHDYGASVGQELLARQKDGEENVSQLGKMIFLNGGMFPGQLRTKPMMRITSSPIGFLTTKLLNKRSFGKNLTALFGPATKPDDAYINTLWSLFTERGGNLNLHELAQFINDQRRHEERWVSALSAAANRVGLINGGSDPVSGAHSYRQWVNTMPDAAEHFLADIGHYPHIEAPAEVASTTLNWLADDKLCQAPIAC